jgi:hypothetical protein
MNKLTPEDQVRILRTEARKPGAEDLHAMENRVLVLDALYTLAGRDNPDSTMHGLYTGLWAEPPANLP